MLQMSITIPCLVGLILTLGINAHTDGLCTTSDNETGVCVPSSTCRAIIQLLQGVPPLERLTKEDQSVCGGSHITTNICCVLSNISNNNATNIRTSISSDTQGYCRSLNGKDEVCLPILECVTIVNLLKLISSPERLPAPVVETVRQAHCGTFKNVPYVCCIPKSREVTAPEYPTSDNNRPVIQKQSRCMTQQNEIGVCVPILSCMPIVQLLNTSSVSGSLTPSVVESVKMSHCGTFDNIVHVCCARNHFTRKAAFTTTTSRSIVKGSQSSCITLENEMGKCSPILTCAPIVELLQRSPFPLPETTVSTIRKSHCGTFNDIHHVCCPVENNVPLTPNTERAKAVAIAVDQGPCTTLRNEMGLCVPILSCKMMTRLLEFSQQPLPSFVAEIIKQSHCGTFNNNHYVCCKINSTTKLGTLIKP